VDRRRRRRRERMKRQEERGKEWVIKNLSIF
jgi:hypothetical protein